MNLTKHTIRKSAIAAAITASLGTALMPVQSSAANLTFDVSGWFTMLNAGGTDALVNADASGQGMYGRRTAVNGTMTFDTATNSGSISLNPFSFFGSGDAVATSITFSDVDGVGGAGTVMLGNMGFNWNGTTGIPVSIAWDQAGLLDAINQGIAIGDTVGTTAADWACDNNITCSTAATDSFLFNFGKKSYTLPLGPSPITTTTFNTTDIGTIALNDNPSGTLPLVADSIGGSPMKAGPFPGFNANFDFTNLTMTSDGSGSVTPPATPVAHIPESPLPATSPLNLGPATNVAPPGTAEYCTDGSVAACDAVTVNGWIADNGTNTINVPITQTTNNVRVDWRAGGGVAFATQTATVIVDDMTAPVIDSAHAQNISVNVTATSDNVCFGAITATDNVEPTPGLTLEWSHDGFNYNPANPDTGNLSDNCSTGFGPNANTITWRATDAAGNPSTYTQTVTLNLPSGIVGKACTIDLATTGNRDVDALFTMRDPSGSVTPAGVVDTTVTGTIDTSATCPDESCTTVGAALATSQPFFGSLWTATPIRLFGPGSYDFETCPFPRTQVGSGPTTDFVSPDGSNKCGDLTTPNLLHMDVGPGQMGAHMLFDWSVNTAIDVAVVWDVGCNQYMLTTTDPDGDGILGSRMVDGPFKGWNAAFDLKTKTGVPPIADGGFTTTIPAVQNSISGTSPLPLTVDNTPPSVSDPAAVRSCVGECFDFTTTELQSATDGGGAYEYAQVVLPLSEATPFWSLYRKFDTGSNSWGDFVIDARNDVKTAPLDNGACPEPGNGVYDRPSSGTLTGKLRGGDMCVQLTIEDGGPNDADGSVNSSVSDPGGVAEVAATALPDPQTGGGGCSLSSTPASAGKAGAWWLLAGFLTWLGWSRRSAKRN